MRHIDLLNIRLNQIQIFLTTVECGTLTAAADRLHLTQPMITKTVQLLEKELGIVLFYRSHGRMQLTPAGQECYARWNNILKYFEQSVEAAHSLQEGLIGRVRVGTGSLGDGDLQLMERFRAVREAHPNLNIQLEFQHMTSLVRQVQQDRFDAVIVSGHLRPSVESYGLCWKTVCESCLAIFVPDSSKLFHEESITFEDLKTERFVCFSADADEHYITLLSRLAQESGFVPKISCYVDNELSFKANLMLGNGVVLADSCSALEGPTVRKFELTGLRNDLILVWKEGNANSGLKMLIDVF